MPKPMQFMFNIEDRRKAMNLDLDKACQNVDEFKRFIKTLRDLYATNKNDPLLRYGVGELRRRILWNPSITDVTLLNKIPDENIPETLERLETIGPMRIQEKTLQKKQSSS